MALTFVQLKEGLEQCIAKHVDSKQESGTTGSLVFGNELVNESNVTEVTKYLQKRLPNIRLSLRTLRVNEDRWGCIFYDWHLA